MCTTTEQFTPSIQSQLHAWNQDRRLRNRVPLEHCWRGCLGLGLLFDGRTRDYCHHGLRMLAPNSVLRWVALREIPPGHFPTNEVMDRRPVSYVSITQGQLRHGQPVLDFSKPSRQAWDFRFQPAYPEIRPLGRTGTQLFQPGPDVLNPLLNPRELDLLNALSFAMTGFAYFGLDHRGKPVRPAWFDQRPIRRSHQIRSAESFMPIPFLGFARSSLEQLYRACTQSRSDRFILICPHCREASQLSLFQSLSCQAKHGRRAKSSRLSN